MKTIQEVVESTIRKTPFIEEALHEKLINVSSLARIILPEISTILKKDVKKNLNIVCSIFIIENVK